MALFMKFNTGVYNLMSKCREFLSHTQYGETHVFAFCDTLHGIGFLGLSSLFIQSMHHFEPNSTMISPAGVR